MIILFLIVYLNTLKANTNISGSADLFTYNNFETSYSSQNETPNSVDYEIASLRLCEME